MGWVYLPCGGAFWLAPAVQPPLTLSQSCQESFRLSGCSLCAHKAFQRSLEDARMLTGCGCACLGCAVSLVTVLICQQHVGSAMKPILHLHRLLEHTAVPQAQ